jgi:very-short-patch-repair endonuclease
LNQESVIRLLSELSAASAGVFRGGSAVERRVTRKQLGALSAADIIERVHPDVYRMTVVARSPEQRLRAALIWGGKKAAACGRSAGATYGLAGVAAPRPEIVVPRHARFRCDGAVVHRAQDMAAMMVRQWNGISVTGVEATLVALAHALDGEAFEVACEDARRRRLTTIPALHAYLERFGTPGRAGVVPFRRLLDELDPVFPSRSVLEVKTRRLLVANGLTDFVREFPLTWNGRTYRFDFVFERSRTILEMNGRRWHDDPTDYARDNEKWSVPGRLGYRIVFATWENVTEKPEDLISDLRTTLKVA